MAIWPQASNVPSLSLKFLSSEGPECAVWAEDHSHLTDGDVGINEDQKENLSPALGLEAPPHFPLRSLTLGYTQPGDLLGIEIIEHDSLT